MFRGLQAQFAAAGEGVLAHTSGTTDYDVFRGRWDAVPTSALPGEVCDHLFG